MSAAEARYIEVIKHTFILTAYTDMAKVEIVAGPWTCAIGANPDGKDKQKVGDCRTPEGRHLLVSIEQSATWRCVDEFAYGPWFLRLAGLESTNDAWIGIAIHGTCHPETIGTRSSHGCIRLLNEQITVLKELVRPQETQVMILP